MVNAEDELAVLDISGLVDGSYWVRIWADDLASNQTGIDSHIYEMFTVNRSSNIIDDGTNKDTESQFTRVLDSLVPPRSLPTILPLSSSLNPFSRYQSSVSAASEETKTNSTTETPRVLAAQDDRTDASANSEPASEDGDDDTGIGYRWLTYAIAALAAIWLIFALARRRKKEDEA